MLQGCISTHYCVVLSVCFCHTDRCEVFRHTDWIRIRVTSQYSVLSFKPEPQCGFKTTPPPLSFQFSSVHQWQKQEENHIYSTMGCTRHSNVLIFN